MGNCFQPKIQPFVLEENDIKLILQISGSDKKFDDVQKNLNAPEDQKELEHLSIIMEQDYLNPPPFFNSTIKDVNNTYSQYEDNNLKISNLRIGLGWTAYDKNTLKKMFETVDFRLSKTIFLVDKKNHIIWYINNLHIDNILIYKFQMTSSTFDQFKNGFCLAHRKFYKQSA